MAPPKQRDLRRADRDRPDHGAAVPHRDLARPVREDQCGRLGQVAVRGAFGVIDGSWRGEVDPEHWGGRGGGGVDLQLLDEEFAELLAFGVGAVVDDVVDVLAEGGDLLRGDLFGGVVDACLELVAAAAQPGQLVGEFGDAPLQQYKDTRRVPPR